MTDVDLAALEAEIATWKPEARARAFRELAKLAEHPRRIFYCGRGRTCDGEPHEGADYPHARADQWPPGDPRWFVWALVGGRGSGKTRAGAEFTRAMSDKVGRIALVAATAGDARDTMIEGESGLIAVCEAHGIKIEYKPALKRVEFPNGCRAGIFSGEEPSRLRGPQHGFAWLDEPAHYPLIEDVWSNLLLGLRLGRAPRIAITTTPLPLKWLKELLADERTRKSRVSTYANLRNLAPEFADNVLSLYQGTRLGRQELYGEVLEDVEGALWQLAMLHRTEETIDPSELERIVVAIDPAGSANRKSDETGLVVVGKKGKNAYVLADYTDKYSPNGWAEKADKLYREFHADAIVAEKNFGGDMVKSTLQNTGTKARIKVKTAAKSKQLRAEPIVGLYEQTRVFHAKGVDLEKLEDEMLSWVPGEGASPNRVDALVWGIDELIDTTPPGAVGRANTGQRIARRSPLSRGRIGRQFTSRRIGS